MYLYVYSDTSSTCSPRMRKYSDGKDRHGAVIVQYGTGECRVAISNRMCMTRPHAVSLG